MAGKLVHFELPAADAERAKGFWSGVFGWEFGDSAMPGIEYYMVSLAKVGEHGGKAEDKLPIPHVGWFAHCSDTEGNDFSLFQSDESVAG